MVSIKSKGPGYCYIPNFFSKDELDLLKMYVDRKLEEKNLGDFCYDYQSPLAPSFYKDSLMETFLRRKKDLVESVTGLQLLPTYTYWRYYIFGSILEDHRDRPSCEVSVTACINQSEKWPIHMDNNWIEMKEGDAVAYLGNKVLHGRKKFQGDYNEQVFFHYVDRNGSYTEHENDNINEGHK